MGVLGEMFPRKRIHDDADAAQGGQRWQLGPIDLDNGVVTLEETGARDAEAPTMTQDADGHGGDGVDGAGGGSH